MSQRTDAGRRRATSFGPHDRFLLNEWGDQLREAFGEMAYLVGSTARGENDWRDVDVRLMSDWADDVDTPNARGASSARTRALNLSVTLWGRLVTGLPIDFQFQRKELFATYDGQDRNPLFVAVDTDRAGGRG